MRKQHSLIYLVEFGIIGAGFAYLLAFSMPMQRQLIVLGVILMLYIAIGLMHHKSHHDVTLKVMLEYILVSALMFALFIFLNITRI